MFFYVEIYSPINIQLKLTLMYILVVFVRYVSLFLQWAISPIAQLFIDLGTIFLVEFINEIW